MRSETDATIDRDADTGIDRPIFILGPHRSGTTLLFSLLARHPDVGCTDGFDQRWPRMVRTGALLRRLDLRFGATRDPHEAQHLWDLRWRKADDQGDAADADARTIAWYRWRIAWLLASRGRARFVAKYPRLSLRVGWLDALFPGALFIHVTRDWRAVVASTVVRKRKRAKSVERWFGVRIPGWEALRDLPHEDAAGRIYRHVTEALERDAARWPDRFVRIGYEALCAAPRETLRDLAEHCGLAAPASFLDAVPAALTSANDKWKTDLDPAAIERIRALDPAFFARCEHDDAPAGAPAAPPGAIAHAQERW